MQLFLEYPQEILVSGSDIFNCTGNYRITFEKSSGSPNLPVYKLVGGNRYIYFHSSDTYGWRIGQKDGLDSQNAEQFFYASKYCFLNFRVF